jgi:hypothetical protein
MEGHNQNKARYESREKANVGMLHPIAKGESNGDDRKAGNMKPQGRLRIISDKITPPFLDFFVISFRLRLRLESENDLFH